MLGADGAARQDVSASSPSSAAFERRESGRGAAKNETAGCAWFASSPDLGCPQRPAGLLNWGERHKTIEIPCALRQRGRRRNAIAACNLLMSARGTKDAPSYCSAASIPPRSYLAHALCARDRARLEPHGG